jgi:transposase
MIFALYIGMKILDFRKLCPQAQEEIRKRAVQAVLSGRSEVAVAADFGVSAQTVCEWMGRYRKHGESGLRAKPRGTHKKGGKLAPWECAYIAKAMDDHYPEELDLPFYLWSRAAVAMLAREKFGIIISPSTASRYLRRWSFTLQVPIRRAYGRSPKEVDRWLHHRFPAIVSQALKNHGVIVWADEVGFHSYDNYGRSFGRRGETPVIRGSGSRFGYNLVSAITNAGRFCSMGFKENFRGSVFIKFLRRLLVQFKEKIYLIIDQHPVHSSALVSAWFAHHAERIRVYFLPGCSPELNPDELFNNDIKANAVGRMRPRNVRELIAFVNNFIWSKGHSKPSIAAYFKETHVLYASASAISSPG